MAVYDIYGNLVSANGGAFKDEQKQALLAFLQDVVMKVDNGQDLYDAVYTAFYTVDVVYIMASFNQGDNPIFTVDSLNDLKHYLTVTAYYDNGTSGEVTAYTLSGELTAGTCTITVSYNGKTTTFNVNVTACTDVTPALSSFAPVNNTSVSVDSANNSIRVYSRANQTYGGANYTSFAWESGYTYFVSVDIEYVSGTARVTFRNTSTSSVVTGTGSVTQSGHYKFAIIPSENSILSASNPCGLSLFVTWSTSVKGDATFKNLRVVKYLAESEDE